MLWTSVGKFQYFGTIFLPGVQKYGYLEEIQETLTDFLVICQQTLKIIGETKHETTLKLSLQKVYN